jgi:hypothetical protein
MAAQHVLYTKVLHVTQEYLGPAAERFITRQIRDHLHKDPERLAKRDMEGLIEWIALAMGFLTKDENMIDEYISRLRNLTQSTTNREQRS